MKKAVEKVETGGSGGGEVGKRKIKSVFHTPDIGEHAGTMKRLEELWGKK